MSDHYFEIPFFKKLTSIDGWNPQDKMETHYHVARAFFLLKTSQMPGPSMIGGKFEVLGKVGGMSTERIRTIEIEYEAFQQIDTIKKSIVESQTIEKILDELTIHFGNKLTFQVGGKVSAELSETLKTTFSSEMKITCSEKIRKLVKYEFKDTVDKELNQPVCGVAVYQQCVADLYLLRVDFLNITYERSIFGLRRKIFKRPFPLNGSAKHPNIIQVGTPVASLKYYELLPRSSRIILDADYSPDVTDDSEIAIEAPRDFLRQRTYWNPKNHPTLYQLSRVAFPSKWIKKKHSEYSEDELMAIELGEAEESFWWTRHRMSQGSRE